MNQFEKLKEEVAAAQAAIFSPINSILAAAEDDAQKYYGKGVRSAGNRLKKRMQEIRKAIKHPAIKSQMTTLQNSAKDLRQNLVESSKTKA
jgi:IS5 family transposase